MGTTLRRQERNMLTQFSVSYAFDCRLLFLYYYFVVVVYVVVAFVVILLLLLLVLLKFVVILVSRLHSKTLNWRYKFIERSKWFSVDIEKPQGRQQHQVYIYIHMCIYLYIPHSILTYGNICLYILNVVVLWKSVKERA